MKENLSLFQMVALHIGRFDLANMSLTPFNNFQPTHNFIGRTDCKYDHASNLWRGALGFTYTVKSADSDDVSLTVQASALFTYEAPETADEKARFEKLIRMNGMVSFLPILRGRISAASAVLGLPNVNIPSLDLNKFTWDNN